MKKCPYCGRSYPDETLICAVDHEPLSVGAPAKTEKADDPNDLVLLTTCQLLTGADLIVSQLASAGIEAFIPDQYLMQTIGFNLNTYGYVRVQVRRKDYVEAKGLLAVPGQTA